jgi:hypothetical protein
MRHISCQKKSITFETPGIKIRMHIHGQESEGAVCHHRHRKVRSASVLFLFNLAQCTQSCGPNEGSGSNPQMPGLQLRALPNLTTRDNAGQSHTLARPGHKGDWEMLDACDDHDMEDLVAQVPSFDSTDVRVFTAYFLWPNTTSTYVFRSIPLSSPFRLGQTHHRLTYAA